MFSLFAATALSGALSHRSFIVPPPFRIAICFYFVALRSSPPPSIGSIPSFLSFSFFVSSFVFPTLPYLPPHRILTHRANASVVPTTALLPALRAPVAVRRRRRVPPLLCTPLFRASLLCVWARWRRRPRRSARRWARPRTPRRQRGAARGFRQGPAAARRAARVAFVHRRVQGGADGSVL